MTDGLTASDVAVLTGNNGRNNDGWGGDQHVSHSLGTLENLLHHFRPSRCRNRPSQKRQK